MIAENDLARHEANIARFLLLKDGGHDGSDAQHQATMAWLRDVAAGRAKLLGVSTGTGSGAPAGSITTAQGASAYDWGAFQ